MSEILDIAQRYHVAYREASGLPVKYTMALYSDWYLFSKEFDPEDLAPVIGHLRRIYKANPEIAAACIRLPKLIQDRGMFASYLAEAQAQARLPKPKGYENLMPQYNHNQARTGSEGIKPVGQVVGECLKGLGVCASKDRVASGTSTQTNPPASARLRSRNPMPVNGLDLLKKFKQEQGME